MIRWIGRCEAEKIAAGSLDVPADQGGMYAIVFDNTFSKQVSKTATLVLMTYPTDSPPVTSQYPHHLQGRVAAAASSSTLGGRASPSLNPTAIDSTDSVHESGLRHEVQRGLTQQHAPRENHPEGTSSAHFTGILLKRRRKRHQGFARRFFSLDFASCTLSYYHNRNSYALRGAIPLSLAAIGANAKRREISVDSGAEVWHLRAVSSEDFVTWRDALEKASSSVPSDLATISAKPAATTALPTTGGEVDDEQEWSRVQALAGRVAGVRDAMRRLECATRPPLQLESSTTWAGIESAEASPTGQFAGDYFQAKDKHQLWKRKPSASHVMTGLFRRQGSGSHRGSEVTSPQPGVESSRRRHFDDVNMHEHCLALLESLDGVVGDFTQLISASKQRRSQGTVPAVSRHSLDSLATGEFFDAEELKEYVLLNIDDSGAEEQEDELYDDAVDASSASDEETPEEVEGTDPEETAGGTLFPSEPDSLSPLPADPVPRRSIMPAPATPPPSLIGFLRKNVGKDLSTISMPVSSNEPLSLLQRSSEQLEYSWLLDTAARENMSSAERLLYVTAFAISSLSNSRVKERAIRKPFNPMLGETFEVVREDLGFRMVAEKVCHRPVRLACQAESVNWTYTQCPMPTQKFWGRSIELVTDGKIRVALRDNSSSGGDRFSWTTATCFLRNLIAGEKYVEPVGTMTVLNETSGEKAVVTFKAKGMFSGRSEEVSVRVCGIDDHHEPPSSSLSSSEWGLTGKWTSSLSLTQGGVEGKTIWEVGSPVNDAQRHYGFTTFAASLNEMTLLEQGRLPPTDSRLRPDQRALELGQLDEAESIKRRLEEAQRARRKEMEEAGREWMPRWFERVPPSSFHTRTNPSTHRANDDDDDHDDDNNGGRHENEHAQQRDENHHQRNPSSNNQNGGGSGGVEEEVWRLKTGRNGYWEERERREWTDVVDLFSV